MYRKLKNTNKAAKLAATKFKAKSPLRGFEFVENIPDSPPADPSKRPINPKLRGELPNVRFQYKEDLPKYRSYDKYVNEAFKARMRYNNDSKEGWWLKLADLQDKSNLPTNITGYKTTASINMPSIGQRYRHTVKLRDEIRKNLKKTKPVTLSEINCVIDLNELSKIDNKLATKESTLDKTTNKLSRNPDISLTGEFIEEQVVKILAHYNIFDDLGIESFSARENVNIKYNDSPVLYGNILTPSQTFNFEDLKLDFEDEKEKYTVAILSLDSGLENKDNYLHYLSHENETVVDYLPFFPTRGTGFHRIVLLIWKDISEGLELDKNLSKDYILDHLDLKYDKSQPFDLQNRKVTKKLFLNESEESAKFLEQKLLAIRLFNTRWDKKVSNIFKEILKIKEPLYEFDFNKSREYKNTSPMTRYTEKRVIEEIEDIMPEEPIYPGGGQPDDYLTSSCWNEFNGQFKHSRRKAGK